MPNARPIRSPTLRSPDHPPGLVSLVGAGPGGADLITVRGLGRLREADVVAFDRLVAPELLDAARPDAERLYVGKHGPDTPAEGRRSVPQEAINALLVSRARAGLKVVRLKGGDPFVFGRGGEEALALRRAGVPFEVVPGVSSALAVPAHAGIPVTQRGVASSLAVVTGHEDPGKARGAVDWGALAGAVDTLVVLMPVGRLEAIAAELIRHGRSPATPAALIENGATPAQRTVEASLGTIAAAACAAAVAAPATLVVGEVVRLRSEIGWFAEEAASRPATRAAVRAPC